MRAIRQLALCAIAAAFFTVLAVGAMACSSIGFVGLPLMAVIFAGLTVLIAHWYGIAWGS